MLFRMTKAVALALSVASLIVASGCGGGGGSNAASSGTSSSSSSRIQSLAGQPGPLDPVQEDVVKIGDQLAQLAPNAQVSSFTRQMSAALAQLLDGPDQLTVAMKNIGQILASSGGSLTTKEQSNIKAQLTQGAKSLVAPTEDSAQSILSAVVSLLGTAPTSGQFLYSSYSSLKSALNTLQADASSNNSTTSQILNDILSVLSNGQSLMSTLNTALGGGTGAGSLPGLGSLASPLQTLVTTVSGVQGGSSSLTSVINLMVGTSTSVSSMPSALINLLNQLDATLGNMPGQLSGSSVNAISNLVSQITSVDTRLIGNTSSTSSGTVTLSGLGNLFATVRSTLNSLLTTVLGIIL